jgi:hypothetical protein
MYVWYINIHVYIIYLYPLLLIWRKCAKVPSVSTHCAFRHGSVTGPMNSCLIPFRIVGKFRNLVNFRFCGVTCDLQLLSFNSFRAHTPIAHPTRVTFFHHCSMLSFVCFFESRIATFCKKHEKWSQRKPKGSPKPPKWMMPDLSKHMVFIIEISLLGILHGLWEHMFSTMLFGNCVF